MDVPIPEKRHALSDCDLARNLKGVSEQRAQQYRGTDYGPRICAKLGHHRQGETDRR